MSRYPKVRGERRAKPDRDQLAAHTIERTLELTRRTHPADYERNMKRVREHFATLGGELAERAIRAMEAIIDEGEHELRAAQKARASGRPPEEPDDSVLAPKRPPRPRVTAGELLRASRELRVWMQMRADAWQKALLMFAVESGIYDTLLRELEQAEREAQAPRADDLHARPLPQPRAPAA